MRLRAGRVADAEALAGLVLEGFSSYSSFAPDWSPPQTAGEESERLRELLGEPTTWSAVAEDEDAVAGAFALAVPAQSSWRPPPRPDVGHLRSLMVTPAWQGTGVAATLVDAIVREAGERGFTAMRLYTPTAQRRARRFYEREGWQAAGEAFTDPGFGLSLVEYRRSI